MLIQDGAANVAQEMPNHFSGASRDLLLDSVLPLTSHFVEGLFNTRNNLRKPTKRGEKGKEEEKRACGESSMAEIAAGVAADAQLDMLTPQRALLVETLCRWARNR